MEKEDTTYGERVRSRRKALGWSQADLGERSSYTKQWISLIENGADVTDRTKTLIDLALDQGEQEQANE